MNHFTSDTAAEEALIRKKCAEIGVEAVLCTHWAEGSKGAEALARAVVKLVESKPANFKYLYPDDMPLWDKMRTIATTLYGARDITAEQRVRDQLKDFEKGGFGHFPVCMAKTQYSSGGAEFVVAVCGEIMTMPGLPRAPAAERIRINEAGLVEGLF